MLVEFRGVTLPNELDDLLEFDRRVFGRYPDDLFEAEDWNNYESYWMFADGIKVGCTAFEHDVDYDGELRPGCLFIASTGILPEFEGKRLGRKQKEWQIKYASEHGFFVIVTNMRQSNARILHLNESLGFTFRCLDPDYYHDPDEPATVVSGYKSNRMNWLA